MKVLSQTPFKNNWQRYYKKYFESRGHEFKAVNQWTEEDLRSSDVALCNWGNEWAIQLTRQEKLCKKYIVVIRSYEMYAGRLEEIDWDKVDHVVFVNDYFKRTFEHAFPYCKCNKSTIFNAIDLDEWQVQEHSRGTRIALVANINHKKGLQFLLHILAALPPEYTLHIAGAVQEPRFFNYLRYMGEELKLWNTRLFFDNKQENVQEWLKDKDYVILSSPAEGNPNCIIEALALGIKPCVHNFPGSLGQFPKECMFNTISEAVEIITSKQYHSARYREYAETHYDCMKQYAKLERIMS